MSFLDDTGLAYFYNKIKTKFISSVTAGTDDNNLPIIHTPDENGNITINNVETANNLKADDALISQDTFIYRTSGGSASLSSGDAELVYVNGNMSISGRIEENFEITSENNIIVACSDNNTWRAQHSASGTYTFYYLAPNSSTAVSDSWTANGAWTHESIANISLSSYGLTATGIVNPSINLACNSSTITATIVPNTWMSYIETSGTFTFYYDEEDNIPKWLLDGETSVTLATYGITITGTPEVGDIIIVTYVKGTPNSTVTIVYTAPDRGRISIATPTSFSATGFNQFDKSSMYIQDANFSNGAIGSNSGTYVCYCKAKGGVDNGYVAYSESGKILDIGWCDSIPTIGGGVITTGAAISSTLASIPFDTDGYVAVVVNGSSGMDDLCIHPKWSGRADTVFEEYSAPSTITLPTQDINEFTIPVGSYGMPAVGIIADRLNLEAGIYIKNIERLEYSTSNLEYVISLDTPYEYDLTEYDAWDNITYQGYIYYVLANPVSYTVEVDPVYVVNDWGTEEFIGTSIPVTAQLLYGQNLRDKLRTDVVTISAQELTQSQKNQVCANIGAVKTIGGTISGDLKLEKSLYPGFLLQSTDADYTEDTRSETVTLSIYHRDKNNKNLGYWQTSLNTTGRVGTTFAARRSVGGTEITNSFSLRVAADGTATVSFSHPGAWRNGLGLGTAATENSTALVHTSGNETISGVKTFSSGIYTRSDIIIGSTDRYKDIVLQQNSSANGNSALIRIDAGNATNQTSNRFLFLEYSPLETAGTANTGFYESYRLPAPTKGLAANATYEILTSKSPVTIAQGGSGQSEIIYTSTASNIITPGTGITITYAYYAQWGRVAQITIAWKSSTAITVPADGNITNITVGHIVSGKRPKLRSGCVSNGDEGGQMWYSVLGDGEISLGACEGTGTTRTIPANTQCWVHATYILS